jgi:NADH-quinone oxidoreductase subunit F
MLHDKDRIFTNIYGQHDKSLAGAMARGHWVKQAKKLAKGWRPEKGVGNKHGARES